MSIIEELRKIAEEHDGILQPEAVVEAARPASSPLHSKFTWDNSEAAHQYRLWQARQLIRVTVMTVETENKSVTVRAWVNLTSDRGEEDGGYRELSVVLGKSDWRKQMLQDALEEMQRFEVKYASLKELADLFKVSKEIRTKVLQG